MSAIDQLIDTIRDDLEQRLPHQRKTQRDKLAILVGTMLHIRSANLMELAAGLPRDVDRPDMRYQWIVTVHIPPFQVVGRVAWQARWRQA